MPSEGQSHIALDVQPEEQCVSSQADGQPGAPAGSASSHPEYNVALRIEELSSGHLKGIMFVEYLGGALGLAAAILARIYVQNEEMQWFLSSRDLYITELVVGCACAATLLVAFLYFFKRVASVARHKSQWSLRAQRTVVLTTASALMQLLNLACLIGSNSYVLDHACQWFSNPPAIMSFLRFSCFNSTLALLHVFARGTQPWVDQAGNLVECSQSYPIFMDAPWILHWPIFVLWSTIEVLWMVPFIVARTTGVGLPRVIKPAASCFDATWLCEALPWQTGMDIAAAVLMMCYFVLYLTALRRCYHLLRGQSYSGFLDSNIRIRLQARGIVLPYLIIVLTVALGIDKKAGDCRPQIELIYGQAALMIVLTTLALCNLLLYMPLRSSGARVIQAQLRDFAWTEAELPAVKRKIRQQLPQEMVALKHVPPVFCFQTGVQLIAWSHIAYTYPGETATKGPAGKYHVSQEGLDADSADETLPGVCEGIAAQSTMLARNPHDEAAAAMRMYGLSHIQHFWESTKDTRLLLAWSRTTVVLAFRGTASLKNAQTDLSFWLQRHPQLKNSFLKHPRVHAGFLGSWRCNNLHRTVLDYIRGLMDSGQVDRAEVTFFLTGHSLGGSLAQVAALDLALDPDLALQSEQIVCYAIAAPRVGTHAFAKAYEVAVPHTWNIINDQDAIPRNAKFFVYKRPGQRAVLNYRGELLVRPGALESRLHLRVCGSSVGDHLLGSYTAAAVAVVQAQFTARRFPNGMQGAMRLLAVPDVRDELERAGLDWKTLSAVASGQVTDQEEIFIGKKRVKAKVAPPTSEGGLSGVAGLVLNGGRTLLEGGLIQPLSEAVGVVKDAERAAADLAGSPTDDDECLQQEITLDEEGMAAIRASEEPAMADALSRATDLTEWPFVVHDPIVIPMM